jgi:REP element-mobilizing transposase RayT
MKIKEKPHRLPKEYYEGELSVVFTLCIKGSVKVFIDPDIVNIFIGFLTSAVIRSGCIIPGYCFMPDHQHLIIMGTNNDSDILKAIIAYKQRTGYWMSRNRRGMRWQKDFYDHLIRTDERLATHVRYILDNPVRKGLVSSWEHYPYRGSIGCTLEDVLHGIM